MAERLHQSVGNGKRSGAGVPLMRIPVCLRLYRKQMSGHAPNLTSSGMRVLSASTLGPGTPLALQLSFGTNSCYLNLSGQVSSCLLAQDGPERLYEIGVQFVALRDFERKILASAIEELEDDPVTQEKCFVTIDLSKDAVAEEAAHVTAGSPSRSGLAENPRAVRKPRWFTPDPPWVLEMKERIQPHWEAVLACPLVRQTADGTLSLTQMRAWMTQLYPFIETFPKWIALNIAKTQDPVSRGFMIDNVRVEKRHAEQWLLMADGFGIDPRELHTVQPIPEVDALTHWLWSINTQGSLPEGVGATNYAIEGITHDISNTVVKGFPLYEGREGLHLPKKAYWWMEAHAKYDDMHPIEALHVMKLYTTSKELEAKVMFAVQRSLEYMLMALEACYTRFQPVEASRGGGNGVVTSSGPTKASGTP
jgi:pyrroloquinoline quinone (PQQ) biosynthesis protein C